MGLESIRLSAPLSSGTGLAIGTGSATFARASDGTFIEGGTVKTASSNVARFQNSALLMEGARTNIVEDSDDFSAGGTPWSTVNATTGTADIGVVAPDGSTGGVWKLTATGADQPRVEMLIAVPGSDTVFTWSVFAKRGDTAFLGLTRFSTGAGAVFDLDNQTINEVGTIESSKISGPFGPNSDWFLCEITETVLSTDAFAIWKINQTDSATDPNSGSIGDSVHIWGAQLEIGDFRSSYIRTSGASATRSEDQLSYVSANWPTIDTTFTAAVNVKNLSDGALSGTVVSPTGATGTNDLGVDASDQFRFRYGGVTSTDTVTSTIAGQARSIITWNTAGNQNLYTDTVLRDTDATVDAGGAVTEVRIGRLGAASNNFFGEISNLRIYDDELTQAEIDLELATKTPGIVSSIPNSIIGSMIGSIVN